MFTWSENPQEDMWNQLKFFSNQHNCKRLLSGDIPSGRTTFYHDEDILNRKSTQISMSISQAFDYFKAADNVSLSTSPLLLFYGMLALSKALIVANVAALFLQDIKYHGLENRPKTNDLKTYMEHPEKWVMEKEFAITNDGVFKQLCNVLNSGAFQDGSIIKFGDLLSVCPEISDFYFKYYNKPSRAVSYYSYEVISNDPLKVKMSFYKKDSAVLYNIIPELATHFTENSQLIHNVAKEFISNDLTGCDAFYSMYDSVIGGRYIIGCLPFEANGNNEKRALHQLLNDYVALYILSIIVRYKQDFWGEVIEGKMSGIISLIELYMKVVKRRFPNIILEKFVGEVFDYGQPARLS